MSGGEAGSASGGEASVIGNGGGNADLRPLVQGSDLSLGGDPAFDGPGFPETGLAGGMGGAPPSDTTYCDGPGVAQTPLDLIVTDRFVGLGWYEESGKELSVVGSPDRAPGAVGAAFGLHWKQQALASVGLELQTENDNWDGPGLCIEPGAAKIQFQARGYRGGESVTFNPGTDAIADVQLHVQLTDDWQTFEIPLLGFDYDHYFRGGGARAGLSITLNDPALGDQRIYVDDIRWLATPGSKCTPPLALPATCDAAPPPNEPPAEAAPICDTTPPVSGRLLLDDFEDGDGLARPFPNGRAHWEVLNDGSPRGVQYPAPCVTPTLRAGSIPQNQWSMRTYGCGFGIFGAGLLLVFEHDSLECLPAFADYTGLDFMLDARLALPVVLAIATVANTPVAQGGTCTTDCSPLFYVVQATPGSQRYSADFADFGRFFDPSTILSIAWMAPPEASSFDFSLDDVGFHQ